MADKERCRDILAVAVFAAVVATLYGGAAATGKARARVPWGRWLALGMALGAAGTWALARNG